MRMPGREPLSIAESGGRNRVTAIIAPDRGPSHPRSLHHGSRLPAMSRVGPQLRNQAPLRRATAVPSAPECLSNPADNSRVKSRRQLPCSALPASIPHFAQILGVLSGNLYGLIDCGLLTSGLLRRVTQGNEQ